MKLICLDENKKQSRKYYLLKIGITLSKCYAEGRGVSRKGGFVGIPSDFIVYTKGAGKAELEVLISGPGLLLLIFCFSLAIPYFLK